MSIFTHKSNSSNIFAEKLLGDYALQKLLTFFLEKMAEFSPIIHLKI